MVLRFLNSKISTPIIKWPSTLVNIPQQNNNTTQIKGRQTNQMLKWLTPNSNMGSTGAQANCSDGSNPH